MSSNDRLHYAWVVLMVGTLVVLGALGLARFGYSIVLPAMQKGLGLTNAETGLLATANLAGYVLLSALGGALASRFGARSVASTGLLVAAAGMLLTAAAGAFSDAAAWRFVTGVGSGAANVSVMGMLAAWFAARKRGLAAGVAVSGSSLALIGLGPLVPRVLAAYGDSGWRACWLIFGGTTVALAALAAVLLRNRPGELGLEPVGATGGTRPRTPAAGEKDYRVESEAAETDDAAQRGEASQAGGAAEAWRGKKEEAKRETTREGTGREQLSWGSVYLSGRVWHLGLVYTAFGFSYIIYLTFFVKRLVDEGGYTRGQAGSLFMTMGWASLLCGFLWGGVSDRIGRRGALVIVYLIHTVSFAVFAAWPADAGFAISAVLFGLSAWSVPAIMAAACGDVLGPRMAPAALGFVTLFFGIGQAVGPSVAGLLADATGSFSWAYYLAAAVALLGAIGSGSLRRGG